MIVYIIVVVKEQNIDDVSIMLCVYGNVIHRMAENATNVEIKVEDTEGNGSRYIYMYIATLGMHGLA